MMISYPLAAKTLRWAALMAATVLTASAAPACISGNTLDTYASLGAGGCMVGPITAKDFAFSVVSFGGGASLLADTDIVVTTSINPGRYGLIFSAPGSPGFGVLSGQFVNYLIAYTWDPSGSLRGLEDILDPGDATIVTDGCVGVAFVGPLCGGTPIQLTVSQGAKTQLKDTTFFTPVAVVGVRHNINIHAKGSPSSFDSLENYILTPELSSWSLSLAGLALVGWRARRQLLPKH
ncbi:MAG: hypothetical protein NTZ56_15250 [Acidobacteria bacterium]|nr:hypothetical protein [Acidobacteriota bacterium]